MNDVELGWASPVILIWKRHPVLHTEFETVCDFFEWAQEIAKRLIESANSREEK